MAFEPKTPGDTLPHYREDLSKKIGNVAAEGTAVLQNFNQKVQGARTTLSDAQTAVTRNAKKYAQSANSYVLANPWKAIGIAAVASAVIGMMLSRR